jgi:hypothetical protein
MVLVWLDIQRWLNQPLHSSVRFHQNQSPGNLGNTYAANRHLRFGEIQGVTYEKPVILNPFTSNKHECQAQSTSPDSSAKRPADRGSRITSIYTRHSANRK